MPTNPKRTSIVDRIATDLGAITAGATYHTTLTNHVFKWRPKEKVYEEVELPAVNIRDVPQGIEEVTFVWNHTLRVELDIIAADADTYRKVVMDVLTAIAADRTLNDLVYELHASDDEMDTEQKDKVYVSGTIPLEMRYRTNEMQI
jgi:hypothetical protein